MISFWVSRVPVSSTLQTSFAEGGRCSIWYDSFIGTVMLPSKAKTIPHSKFHHLQIYLTIVNLFGRGKKYYKRATIRFLLPPTIIGCRRRLPVGCDHLAASPPRRKRCSSSSSIGASRFFRALRTMPLRLDWMVPLCGISRSLVALWLFPGPCTCGVASRALIRLTIRA